MVGTRQPPMFPHVPVCLPSAFSGNLVLIVGNAVGRLAPLPPQLDAGRGLLAAAARCALLHVFCISPVTGLTDRKRLVQQLTQNETSAELPANICIGYLAGSPDRPVCYGSLSRIDFTVLT